MLAFASVCSSRCPQSLACRKGMMGGRETAEAGLKLKSRSRGLEDATFRGRNTVTRDRRRKSDGQPPSHSTQMGSGAGTGGTSLHNFRERYRIDDSFRDREGQAVTTLIMILC